MLSKLSIKTKVNAVLSISIVILSILSIIWNFDMRTLYLEQDKHEVQYNKTMAMHKQLLTKHSQIISGNRIKDKAIKVLKMKAPKSSKQVLL